MASLFFTKTASVLATIRSTVILGANAAKPNFRSYPPGGVAGNEAAQGRVP